MGGAYSQSYNFRQRQRYNISPRLGRKYGEFQRSGGVLLRQIQMYSRGFLRIRQNSRNKTAHLVRLCRRGKKAYLGIRNERSCACRSFFRRKSGDFACRNFGVRKSRRASRQCGHDTQSHFQKNFETAEL